MARLAPGLTGLGEWTGNDLIADTVRSAGGDQGAEMTAHSFGNTWVGVKALAEPPVAPAVQHMGRGRRPASPSGPAVAYKGVPSIDLGEGLFVNAPTVRSALLRLARAHSRNGRTAEAGLLLGMRQRLIDDPGAELGEDLKLVLRKGFGAV
ncbi:hypothetical protein [Streptomyces olivaceoviridis]|uniref:hypothetical protein n=1 Tax=Streptomyces olivaceoviridis TaxID=1921 RepID=UPI003329C8BE